MAAPFGGPVRVGLIPKGPLPAHISPDAATSARSEGWSKWDVALCLGATAALGFAGYWYYNNKIKGGDKVKKKDRGDSGDDDLPVGTKGQSATGSSKDQPQSRQELAQAAKTKGNRFFKEGKYEEAIKCYTEAITICPPDFQSDLSTFYQNRAAAYENQKLYEKVIEDCNSALKLNPKYTKALARRSKAFEVQEKFRESLEDITKACLLEGFQSQPYLQAADRVLKSLGRSRASVEYKGKKPNRPSKFYVQNYLAGFVNDPVKLKFTPKETADIANLGVKLKEGEPEAERDEIGDNGAVLVKKPSAFERAKHCLSSEDYEQIIPLCDEELKNEESQFVAEALLLRGTMKLLQGLGDEAIEDLERVGSMEEADTTVRSTAMLREACLRMQRNPEASSLAKLETAKGLDKANSDLYHHHGQQLLQLEMLDEAVAQFNTSIGLSDFPISYVQKFYAIHRKAVTEENLTLLAQAKEGFEKTLAKFPKCSDALILYAQALSDQGKFEEAEKFFDKAINIQPQNANNVVHKGLMLLQWKGDVDGTMKLLEQALQVDPTCQYAHEIRGTIEVQRGRLPDAIKSFKKAISLSNSESEMAHLFSLMEAAEVQVKVARDLNIQLPSMGGGMAM